MPPAWAYQALQFGRKNSFLPFRRNTPMKDIVCSLTCYPQSSGKLERAHKTIKSNAIRKTVILTFEGAVASLTAFIDHNNKRLQGIERPQRAVLWWAKPEDVGQAAGLPSVKGNKAKRRSVFRIFEESQESIGVGAVCWAHPHYVMHCLEVGKSLCPENYIVLFQLPNLVDDGKMDNDLMMWLRIFKEGKYIDPNHPPEWAQQGISKEVMEVLRHFANDRDEYLAYDSYIKARREHEGLAESEAEAKKGRLEEKRAKEKALKELRRERRAKEKVLKDLSAQCMATEAERSAKESALMEIERLRALLGKSLG